MGIIKNSIKVAGIAILVAVLGGIIQALSNFHSTNGMANLFMSIFGGVIIGGLNAFMHQIQGTTVVPKTTITENTGIPGK
jgi:hypothetical protein